MLNKLEGSLIDLLVLNYVLVFGKHIKSQNQDLSAGRVQSALLNLLQEREYINQFEPDIELSIKGSFDDLKDTELSLMMNMISMIILSKHYLHCSLKIEKFKVFDTSKRKIEHIPRNHLLLLQQSAQNELGFPVKMTMDIAQKLYESGHITYMRTDSTFISDEYQKENTNTSFINL